MKKEIKTICLILITLSLMVYVGFYSWNIYKEQHQKEQNNQIAGKKYQECLYQCLCPSEGYQPVECRLCESRCREKYGK